MFQTLPIELKNVSNTYVRTYAIELFYVMSSPREYQENQKKVAMLVYKESVDHMGILAKKVLKHRCYVS